MPGTCSNPDCGFPGTPCLKRSEFPDPERDCPDLAAGIAAGGAPAETVAEPPRPATRSSPPGPSRFWSGHTLGSQEAFSLFTDNPPRFVAVCGREDAGKTCLLVSQYLQIAQGRAPGVRFCGSRTLRGWDQLADVAWEWTGDPSVRIVPRTSLGSHREAGLLHYAFKRRWGGDSRLVLPAVRELVLTDFPGEWFERWALHAEVEAELPWLKRVDVFWVVIDAPRLLSDRKAIRDARSLLSKVLAEAGQRPVALVLTQTDRVDAPEPAVWADTHAWEGRLRKHLEELTAILAQHPGPRTFLPLSAFPSRAGDLAPQGVLDPLRFALEVPTPVTVLPTKPRESDRMFHHFRESAP